MGSRRSRRRTTSIKVDPKLNKQFIETVAEMGMDQCFVEDTFRQAFLDAVGATKRLDLEALSNQAIHPLIIHVDNPHYHYQVLRPRRRKRWGSEEEYKVHDQGSPEKCTLCPQKPAYIIHNWSTRKDCNRLWLCESCFKQQHHKHAIRSWRKL